MCVCDYLFMCLHAVRSPKFFLLTGLATKIKGIKKIAVKHNIQIKSTSVCVCVCVCVNI